MMTRLLVLLLSSALLLSACAPHQARTAPELDMPAEYSQQGAAEPLMAQRWWLSFNDSGLNALMDKLFRTNLGLVQAHARLRQSEALMRQTRAASYPNLSINGQTGSSGQPGSSGDNQGESSQLSVTAGYELDLFGKLASKNRAALLNYQASREEVQSLYISLSAQLADLYFLATEQRAQLALTDETIASYSDTLKRVEDRYRQGLAAAVDVYQARQNLAAARANRQNYSQGLTVAENAIAVLLADYPGTTDLLQTAKIPDAPPSLPTGIPADLLQNRPDLRASLLRVEANDAEVAAAIADRFPSFSLAGSYGGSRSDLTGSLISGDFWSLLLKLSQPIFDGGRRKAEVDRREAQFSESIAAYQENVLRSVQEVQDALSGNINTGLRLKRLQEQVSATAASERLALDRYLYGLTDYLPVLTAQVFHFNAQNQLLATRRQLLSQRISLARALGGNWMTEQLDRDHQHIAEQGNGQ